MASNVFHSNKCAVACISKAKKKTGIILIRVKCQTNKWKISNCFREKMQLSKFRRFENFGPFPRVNSKIKIPIAFKQISDPKAQFFQSRTLTVRRGLI